MKENEKRPIFSISQITSDYGNDQSDLSRAEMKAFGQMNVSEICELRIVKYRFDQNRLGHLRPLGVIGGQKSKGFKVFQT